MLVSSRYLTTRFVNQHRTTDNLTASISTCAYDMNVDCLFMFTDVGTWASYIKRLSFIAHWRTLVSDPNGPTQNHTEKRSFVRTLGWVFKISRLERLGGHTKRMLGFSKKNSKKWRKNWQKNLAVDGGRYDIMTYTRTVRKFLTIALFELLNSPYPWTKTFVSCCFAASLHLVIGQDFLTESNSNSRILLTVNELSNHQPDIRIYHCYHGYWSYSFSLKIELIFLF